MKSNQPIELHHCRQGRFFVSDQSNIIDVSMVQRIYLTYSYLSGFYLSKDDYQ